MKHTSVSFPDRLLFIHIPKTAGTTLRNIIQRIYPPEQICGIYSDPRFLSEEAFEFLPEEEKDRYRVFIGHVGVDLLRQLPASLPIRCMTVLRDPVARVRSEYNHLMNGVMKDKELSFSDWKKSLPAALDNAQVRYLSGTKGVPWGQCTKAHLQQAKDNLHDLFTVVGCSEYLEETLYLAHATLGWPATPLHGANVGTEKKRNMFARITPEDEARIREINQLDLELYAFARDLMWERIAQTAPDWEQRLAEYKGGLNTALEWAEHSLNNELYLRLNPDVRAARVDPMTHFLFHGQFEDRDGAPPLSGKKERRRACASIRGRLSPRPVMLTAPVRSAPMNWPQMCWRMQKRLCAIG